MLISDYPTCAHDVCTCPFLHIRRRTVIQVDTNRVDALNVKAARFPSTQHRALALCIKCRTALVPSELMHFAFRIAFISVHNNRVLCKNKYLFSYRFF